MCVVAMVINKILIYAQLQIINWNRLGKQNRNTNTAIVGMKAKKMMHHVSFFQF